MSGPDGVDRPRRVRHKPRHLDDFLVTLPERHLTQITASPPVHSSIVDGRPQDVARAPPAAQTPHSAQYQSLDPASVLSALQEMQADNQLLRLQMQEVLRAITPQPPAAHHYDPPVGRPPIPGRLHFEESSFHTPPPLLQYTAPPRQSSDELTMEDEDELQEVVCTIPRARQKQHQCNSWLLPAPSVAHTSSTGVSRAMPLQKPLPSYKSLPHMTTELSEQLGGMTIQPDSSIQTPAPLVSTPGYAVPYTRLHIPMTTSNRPYVHQPASQKTEGQRPHNQSPASHPSSQSPMPLNQEMTYRGPKPHIPLFSEDDPRQFARLKLALDNLLPADATERFKYQILLDHLKLEDALLIADSYSNSERPYTRTMAALTELYGQPHKLALQRITEVLAEPPVKSGDCRGFRMFALKVRALVGMLGQLGNEGRTELECGSHVSRLLSKLSHDLRAQFKRFINPLQIPIPTLLDFAEWLEYEVRVQEDEVHHSQASSGGQADKQKYVKRKQAQSTRSTTVLLVDPPTQQAEKSKPPPQGAAKPKKYCPFCDSQLHYFNQCSSFKQLSTEQRVNWIKEGKRCWRCGRNHQAAQCYLKARCQKCNRIHLEVLHEVNSSNKAEKATTPPTSQPATYYLDPARQSRCVLLKMVKVCLHHGGNKVETYAILDDGSERTIILHQAVQELGLQGQKENLVLRTIRQDIRGVPGMSVSFSLSPAGKSQKRYRIKNAFSSSELGLSTHSHPVEALQRTYRHLRGLPLQSFSNVQPLLLIGSDYPHLLTPVEPVRLGRPGGPAALKTRLGWTLQGPARAFIHQPSAIQCLFTNSHSPTTELFQHVSKLWQMDVLPYRNEKLVTRSKQDTAAVKRLEDQTIRVEVDGVHRYATPLLWKENKPMLHAPKEAVLGHLRGTEKRLAREPVRAESYKQEIKKLFDANYVNRLSPADVEASDRAWFIPHHMVHHNGKDRIVFNCSFAYQGGNLNEQLLPGPTLGSSLLGVLLRFRQYPIAVSSDIKGMFHQVRLLPEDRQYLRFLWRNMDRSREPDVYEWQVLPFGTTCSPCCAIFALQKHVQDHSSPEEDTRLCIERCFYVDNLLQSFTTMSEAKQLVNKLQPLLKAGGFELRQWASNYPDIISHLPGEIRSESCELWLSHDAADPQERTLGLLWHCMSDTLSYRFRQSEHPEPTMRSIYRVLARQYDPLGLLIPYTTRAKILVQRLWSKKRDWDDPNLPGDVLQLWHVWESELHQLPSLSLPRCYVQLGTDITPVTQSIHIFTDASERAYGAVAYLRTVDETGHIQLSFLAARSRVAPVRQQSIPRLELCAAHTGAQLAAVLKKELTLPITSVIYWTDSTTVLNWLQSQSCRFKVFVGTRVADIQEQTEGSIWRYVSSSENPADDITRGLTLSQLIQGHRWNNGPPFLQQDESSWPVCPVVTSPEEQSEFRRSQFCGHLSVSFNPPLPDARDYSNYQELLDASVRALHGAATTSDPTAEDYRKAEMALFRAVQTDCFQEDFHLLSQGKTISQNSRLLTLAPEYDRDAQLIRVGGRLRRCETLEEESIHPIVLDPHHPITKLIIQDFDARLAHPGPERVYAELRRRFWILRGRAAVKKHQYKCPECQRWRACPVVPRMADLPSSSLRLRQPAFYSTGMDCFGPYLIKIGRRTEKRWGIVFKCLTMHAIHLDLLASMDTDAFLMALRRFISRRGKPHEIISDQGTNFKGGSSELQEAFKALTPQLQVALAGQQIDFKFNPPNSPHFGGSWEREIRSIKSALRSILGVQTVSEDVLMTVLIEVEGIINSKPLGYASSDIADPDPITPNMLLMGRRDPSLPQVVYSDKELLSRRKWRQCQALADQFWSKFTTNYLPSFQTRSKWQLEKDNLNTGDVVMIIDHQLPRALWPVGNIVNIIPGADGRIRTAQVQVKDRTYTRPVARLIRLPALPSDPPN